jgi:hypothetical protein
MLPLGLDIGGLEIMETVLWSQIWDLFLRVMNSTLFVNMQLKEAIPSLQADWAVGGSAIVAPGGQYLVRPVINKEEILYAELDFNVRRMWKAFFDPIGHYSRPDVYSLNLHALEGREYSYTNEKANFADPFNLNLKDQTKSVDSKVRKVADKYGLDISQLNELYRDLQKV